MSGKKQIYIFILSAILLSGCNTNQLSNVLPNSHIPLEEASPAGSSAQPENSFAPLPEEPDSISVYEDQELGLAIGYLADFPGNYVITFGAQSQQFDIGYGPEDIENLTVSPWDNHSLFLVCDLTFTDHSSQRYIINSEMLSEAMMKDPLETARERIVWDIVEKDGALWLSINQESTDISADRRETLEMLGHNIRPLNDLAFHSENGALACDVPLAIYEEEKIGVMRLYYEFDGVGMNCIQAEFIPLG